MAGDWIKMRGALLDHPKVIALARVLHEDRDFREWLTPGGGSAMNGQTVSDSALRCVTTALLMKVWSVSREHGKFVDKDLVLTHSAIADLDQIAGAPGIGKAMEAVGWAIKKGGVTLPNFIEFNVPMTAAEKQAEYRKRQKPVTESLPKRSNNKASSVTTREEKRREEGNASLLRNSASTELSGSLPEKQTTTVVTTTDARGTRFNLSSLPPEWISFCMAERPDLNPTVTFARFTDHWIAQPGLKGRKTDWAATWRNWVRSETRTKTNGAGLQDGAAEYLRQHEKETSGERIG